MAKAPRVYPGDWITVRGDDEKGTNQDVRAVVSRVPDGPDDPRRYVEVVYLDAKGRAINEDVVWTGSQWTFAMRGPCGGFADQNSSMVIYVRALRDQAERADD